MQKQKEEEDSTHNVTKALWTQESKESEHYSIVNTRKKRKQTLQHCEHKKKKKMNTTALQTQESEHYRIH